MRQPTLISLGPFVRRGLAIRGLIQRDLVTSISTTGRDVKISVSIQADLDSTYARVVVEPRRRSIKFELYEEALAKTGYTTRSAGDGVFTRALGASDFTREFSILNRIRRLDDFSDFSVRRARALGARTRLRKTSEWQELFRLLRTAPMQWDVSVASFEQQIYCRKNPDAEIQVRVSAIANLGCPLAIHLMVSTTTAMPGFGHQLKKLTSVSYERSKFNQTTYLSKHSTTNVDVAFLQAQRILQELGQRNKDALCTHASGSCD
jgi:hypothetical protein